MAKKTKRQFGREWVEDKRDRRYRIVAKETEGVKNWHPGKWSGDQGATPQCVGYAWAHWLTGFPIRQYLPPSGIYQIAQFCDEWEGEDYAGTSVRAGAKVLSLLGFISEYRWAWNVDGLISSVLTTGPVVVGTNWYSGMDKPDTRNRITPTGQLYGGHAYIINGVDTPAGYFRMKNSWGTWWGKNGHAWIAIEDMARLMEEQGEVCLAIEQQGGLID